MDKGHTCSFTITSSAQNDTRTDQCGQLCWKRDVNEGDASDQKANCGVVRDKIGHRCSVLASCGVWGLNPTQAEQPGPHKGSFHGTVRPGAF